MALHGVPRYTSLSAPRRETAPALLKTICDFATRSHTDGNRIGIDFWTACQTGSRRLARSVDSLASCVLTTSSPPAWTASLAEA
jgi:hypothetical protein